MIVSSRYHLPSNIQRELHEKPAPWGFGSFSEAIYYRTYSRTMANGDQESWADTVIRVVEGVMSIRKNWLEEVLGKKFPKRRYDRIAREIAFQIHDLKWLPPGRGLWAMGTEFVYERGSMALNNCGFVDVQRALAPAAAWLMDALMNGVGVGFSTGANLNIKGPKGRIQTYVIADSREGWVESVEKLIRSYERGYRPLEFDYSKIRPAGKPISGFGGVSGGPEPLKMLHIRLRHYLQAAIEQPMYNSTRLIADTMNAIGACVVSGNVRRSAEIALGSPRDETFLNLKNYDLQPERKNVGGMSNNSVVLRERGDFHGLPDLAPYIAQNGEPGVVNMLAIQKYGRTSERMEDNATGINPCGEIPLASKELCCLVEVFPTRCQTSEFPKVLSGATFYASTVALLKSGSSATNEIAAQNRRIGVSVSGIADWMDATTVAHVFDTLNQGYDVVREQNRRLAKEAGVAESVRVTTVKPSGTVSLLAGVSPGIHFPHSGYVLRRVRMSESSPVVDLLSRAGVPHEADVVSPGTQVFSFPLKYGNGSTRSVKDVSVYEQAALSAMLQRCWSDNAVSSTLTFQPEEASQIDRVLAMFAPQIKSVSMLPDQDEAETAAYEQMPLERIDQKTHDLLARDLSPVDWSRLHGSDGEAPVGCDGDACEI